MSDVDDYLATLEPGQRKALERIRTIIRETVPDVEEIISYDMPTFKVSGKRLLYFAAFKKHMSLFGNVGTMEEKLSDFTLSHKGTVQFTEDHPIPESLLKEIIHTRLKEISQG
jgi:uncharacterized protein YdhG (YjbR/CyaY superfamily)